MYDETRGFLEDPPVLQAGWKNVLGGKKGAGPLGGGSREGGSGRQLDPVGTPKKMPQKAGFQLGYLFSAKVGR